MTKPPHRPSPPVPEGTPRRGANPKRMPFKQPKPKPEKNYYQLQKYKTLKYNYALLGEEHRQFVQEAALEIHGRLKRTVEDMIVIGQQLLQVKAMVPGDFTKWLQGEFDMSISSANEFMNIAKRFAEFSTIIVEIAPTAVRLLAAPSVKDEVISAVIEATQAKGKPLLVTEVKAIRDALQPRQTKSKQLTGPTPVPQSDIIEAEYSIVPQPERIISQLADPHTTPIQLAALFDEATADQLQAALDLLPEDADLRYDSLYRQMLKKRRLEEAHAAMLTPPIWASASERQVELLARVIAVKGLLREVEQQQPGLQQAVDDVAGPLKRLIGMLEGKLR